MAVKTQRHIHLDFLTNGADNAPPVTWTAVAANPVFETFASFDRSLDGTPRGQVSVNGVGAPRIYEDYKLEIKIYETDGASARNKLMQLARYMWQPVWFVPPVHPDEGEDHANYRRKMTMTSISEPQYLDPMQSKLTVMVMLKDYSRDGQATGSNISPIEPLGNLEDVVTNLNDLADVDVDEETLVDGDTIVWDEVLQRFVNAPLAAASTLAGQSDVTLDTPTVGEVLVKADPNWENKTLAEAGIAAASHAHASTAITYSPADSGHWADPDPTNVGSALDKAAAAIAAIGGAADAHAIDYTLDETADWPTDPTNVGDALDYLALRVADVEGLSVPDASLIGYTVAVDADWPDPNPTTAEGAFDALAERVKDLEDSPGFGSTAQMYLVDLPPASPSGVDDEFEDAALHVDWTEDEEGGGTFDVDMSDAVRLTRNLGGWIAYKTASNGAGKAYDVCLSPTNLISGGAGMVLTPARPANSAFLLFGVKWNSTNAEYELILHHYTNFTTKSVTPIVNITRSLGRAVGKIYLRIAVLEPSSKFFYFSYSLDGITFITVGNSIEEGDLGGGAKYVGVGNPTGFAYYGLHFFRERSYTSSNDNLPVLGRLASIKVS